MGPRRRQELEQHKAALSPGTLLSNNTNSNSWVPRISEINLLLRPPMVNCLKSEHLLLNQNFYMSFIQLIHFSIHPSSIHPPVPFFTCIYICVLTLTLPIANLAYYNISRGNKTKNRHESCLSSLQLEAYIFYSSCRVFLVRHSSIPTSCWDSLVDDFSID